jgi:hypothetical protein
LLKAGLGKLEVLSLNDYDTELQIIDSPIKRLKNCAYADEEKELLAMMAEQY